MAYPNSSRRAAVVMGIIGVETLYGQNTGNFRLVDALGTLAFHFPQAHPRAAERQAFFRAEFEQFLQLSARSGNDPLSVRGSYAGAMGLPQFMPSSWARHAVDFEGDGRIDLFGSPADAIGSVANYFKAFQWRTGMPTHYPVSLSAQTDMDSLLAPDILPTFSAASFTAKGAGLEGAALAHNGPLALIELRNGLNAPSYVAGTENFYAITRYNWSSYYEGGLALAERIPLNVPGRIDEVSQWRESLNMAREYEAGRITREQFYRWREEGNAKVEAQNAAYLRIRAQCEYEAKTGAAGVQATGRSGINFDQMFKERELFELCIKAKQ